VFKKLGDLGYLGINKPIRYGGMGLDYSYQLVFIESSAIFAAVACRWPSACRPTWQHPRSRALAPTIRAENSLLRR
jgi:alkylation response protein AidB-like acyl-CoA dehydrogenase